MAFQGALLAVQAIALTGTIYQGERQSSIARKGLRIQQQAQRDSSAAAAAAQRRADQENAAANRRGPNASSLLASEQKKALAGPGSTLLTGSRGVSNSMLKLGQTSLLGG